MGEQRLLFEAGGGVAARTSARARRTDSESAHAAAAGVEDKRIAPDQRSVVLRLVERYPGKTSAELAGRCATLNRHQVARRLPELAETGAIRRGRQRTCRTCGRRSVTWWPREGEVK